MSELAEARRQMVASQIRPADVTDRRLQDAMLAIPRERFLPRSMAGSAYADMEIDLGEGRRFMRPRDFAKLVQALGVKPGELVLDLACARGYSTAILSRLCETVIGIESNESFASKAEGALSDIGADNAVIVTGDIKKGAPEQGPFDVILVNGAVELVPDAWLSQLADDGRLGVIVRENGVGRARVYTRKSGVVGSRVVFDSMTSLLPGFEREPEFSL
ncbi:MAG: protein-L-isoaspartate O-methyltransferase family protein [Glycocaulis sp.]|uniref:protein-L-isoaspartate O-methyltransferase family protein n=1 Tax=Glycocaulis sp. TaxID=1969725 RepID=UPI003F7069E3